MGTSLSKRQREIQLDNLEAAGLPVLVCPNCGERGARHWVPDSLDEHELHVPGYYTCEGDDAT
jgi:hypothetical protein